MIGAHGAGLSWLWSMPRGGKASQLFRFGRGKGETGEFLCVVDTDQYIFNIHCMINEMYISISLAKSSSLIEVFLKFMHGMGRSWQKTTNIYRKQS